MPLNSLVRVDVDPGDIGGRGGLLAPSWSSDDSTVMASASDKKSTSKLKNSEALVVRAPKQVIKVALIVRYLQTKLHWTRLFFNYIFIDHPSET